MALSDKKKEEFLREIAKELRNKHEMELYKDCIDVGSQIYEMTKSFD